MNPQDLQRLVEIIAEELLAAQGPGGVPTRCTCHAVQTDCCPTRLRGVLDAGATRLGLHATGGAPGGVSAMIDHTLLKADATRADIEKLCGEAAEFQFATVCVNPVWVALAASRLRGTGVGVCSVVGFPLGATTADVKNFETRRAIFDGAAEIDMVINVGALKSGDLRTVERDIEAVVDPCRQCGVTSKVIIEAALLTDEEKITASTLTKAAGADFVKTSTGFGPGGATVARCRTDAPGRRRRNGRQGCRWRARSRGPESDGRGRRDPRRRERWCQDRPGIERAEVHRWWHQRVRIGFAYPTLHTRKASHRRGR